MARVAAGGDDAVLDGDRIGVEEVKVGIGELKGQKTLEP
jgi:hypothetical protein